MIRNVGPVDRGARLVLGVVMVTAGLTIAPWWFALLGLIPFATGATGFCPLFVPFGISTCPAEPKNGNGA